LIQKVAASCRNIAETVRPQLFCNQLLCGYGVFTMASIAEVVEGLEILAKTASVPLGLAEKGENDRRTAHLGGADHDVIWGPDADPSDEDKTRLEQLGWHFDEELDCWSLFV
jgi:hypothetical protein